ncbi:MAG: S1-like domain-containing RNA-binding protein [Rikenellaceae bacterium]
MLQAGSYQKLEVSRVSDFGLYLKDEQDEEVLLPNRFVSLENKVGDMLDVFVYHDSEDRLVASTEHPKATVGQVAFLRVVDKTVHGAFLEWGLQGKDLFLPNRNQVGAVNIDEKVLVYVYRDNITGRAVATNRLNGYISNADLDLKYKQQVTCTVAIALPMGYRVVIDNKYWGMIYRNQIFRPVTIGDTLEGFVSKITEDNRVDISLQKQGYDQVKISAEQILAKLEDNSGTLDLDDNSSPEQVHLYTGMSKKVFKRSVGYLLKRGDIEIMKAGGIRLIKK